MRPFVPDTGRQSRITGKNLKFYAMNWKSIILSCWINDLLLPSVNQYLLDEELIEPFGKELPADIPNIFISSATQNGYPGPERPLWSIMNTEEDTDLIFEFSYLHRILA